MRRCGQDRRVDQKSNAPQLRRELDQQLQILVGDIAREAGESGDHAPGPREVCNESRQHRVATAGHDDRSIGRGLGGGSGSRRSSHDNNCNSLYCQFLGQTLQPLHVAVRPALLEHHLRALSPAQCRKPLSERDKARPELLARDGLQNTDHDGFPGLRKEAVCPSNHRPRGRTKQQCASRRTALHVFSRTLVQSGARVSGFTVH